VTVPSRRRLISAWLVAAMVLGGLLAISRTGYSGLDDPDQAFQRPGVLDIGPLPAPAPAVTASIPRDGRKAVIFFTRPAGLDRLERAVTGAEQLRESVDVAIVLQGEAAPTVPGPVPVRVEPGPGLARSYGLRLPRDGGPPVGYAIVDRAGRVRYATVDPGDARRLAEVATMLRAVP